MDNEVDTLITSLMHGNQLKRTSRTGWVQRGVPGAENVAAHSYGVAFASLMLAEVISSDLDLGRLLAMALLHDLPEAETSDIPSPSWRLLPPGSKEHAEEAAMSKMFATSRNRDGYLKLWRELQAAETEEARIVHDADKIDLFLQATVYAEQSGNALLTEFWSTPPVFYYPISQKIYDELFVQSKKALNRPD
jgi:putative hydrolase of HD superfamily